LEFNLGDDTNMINIGLEDGDTSSYTDALDGAGQSLSRGTALFAQYHILSTIA
jgi:hypothetical protein